MFTGLVEACTPILDCDPSGPAGAGRRLRVASPGPDWEVALGDSVAVSGCCLTVAEAPEPGSPMVFELSAETLACTWFAKLVPGRRVNLERALQLGARLGGHMVAGHVDGVGAVEAIADSGDGGRTFTFSVPDGFERYLVDKGSVTVDGVSLTVVAPRARQFDVAVIPLTLAETALGRASVGDRVNLEADLVGKWIERLVGPRG